MNAPDYDDEDLPDDGWDTAISGRNCLVLAIDAGAEMFIKSENGKSHFHMSLECCKEILLSIARKQKLELVSIVLYGTHKTEGRHAPENVVLFQPLATVTVGRIKKLAAVLEEECEEVRTAYGHSNQSILSQALHYCQTVMIEDRRKVYVRNLVLFTNNDDPHAGDVQSQHRARKQAEEFLAHHIDFDVVGLGDFDSSKFYKELVLTSRGELLKDWVRKDPILNIQKLLTQVDQITEKYAQRRTHLWLSKDCALQVTLTKLYSEPKKFRTVKVSEYEMAQLGNPARGAVRDAEEDEMALELDNVETRASQITENTKTNICKPPIEAQVKLGGRLLPVTKADLKMDLGLRGGFNLVGFVNSDDLPLYLAKEPPYLMMPASNITNARLIFSHLLNACLTRGKSMVGWFKLHKSAQPQYVLLHPTPGGEYATDKEHSAGFILSKLVYSDDITEPDEPDGEEAAPSEKQLKAAEGIVKKLTIPYTVDKFSDAEIRYRTNMIEALALELDDCEEVEDDTDADLEGIAERLGDLSEDFNDCDHLGPETTGKKPGYGNSAAKKAMTSETAVQMVENGLAGKLTVGQLKDLLKNEGVKNLSAMNKQMLVTIANKRFGGPQ